MDFTLISSKLPENISSVLAQRRFICMQDFKTHDLGLSALLSIIQYYILYSKESIIQFWQNLIIKYPNINNYVCAIANWIHCNCTIHSIYNGILYDQTFLNTLYSISQIIFKDYKLPDNLNCFQMIYKLFMHLNVGFQITIIENNGKVKTQSIKSSFMVYFLNYETKLYILIPHSLQNAYIDSTKDHKSITFHCSHPINTNRNHSGTNINICQLCNKELYNEDKNILIKEGLKDIEIHNKCGKCNEIANNAFTCPDCERFLCKNCFKSSKGYFKCPICNCINLKSLFKLIDTKKLIKEKKLREQEIAPPKSFNTPNQQIIKPTNTKKSIEEEKVQDEEIVPTKSFITPKQTIIKICERCREFSLCLSCKYLKRNTNNNFCQECEFDKKWACGCGSKKSFKTYFCCGCSQVTSYYNSEKENFEKSKIEVFNNKKIISLNKGVCFHTKCQDCNVCQNCKKGSSDNLVCLNCMKNEPSQLQELIQENIKPKCSFDKCKIPAIITCLYCKDCNLCNEHANKHVKKHMYSVDANGEWNTTKFLRENCLDRIAILSELQDNLLLKFKDFIADTEKELKISLNHIETLKIKLMEIIQNENLPGKNIHEELGYYYIALSKLVRKNETSSWQQKYKQVNLDLDEIYSFAELRSCPLSEALKSDPLLQRTDSYCSIW